MREDAIDEYRAALALAPSNQFALRNLSLIYEEKRRFAPARSLVQKLLGLNPNDASIREQAKRLSTALWD